MCKMARNNQEKITKILKEKLKINNKLALPKIEKVVINVGIGQAKNNPKFSQAVRGSLKAITGQEPALRPATKAISGFKISKKEPVGMMITLRGKRMKDFVQKLANIVLPRLRDFRGLKTKGFDKKGNYNLGISEQIVFPEISHEKTEILHGLSVSITTTAKNPKEGQKLLEAWGFPFEKSSGMAFDISQGKPFEKEKK